MARHPTKEEEEESVMQSHIHCVTSARVAIVSGTSS